MNTRSFGGGVFPDVCVLDGQGWLSFRSGDPRVAGHVVVYTWPGDVVQQAAAVRQFSVPAESPAFTRIHAFGGSVWLFYHDGTSGHLHNLMTGSHQLLTPCENNDPACFGDGYIAWQGAASLGWPVLRMSLATGEVVPAGRGAGTGLSRVLPDGRVVLVDDDRFALPGTTRPCFADGVAVGESQRVDNNGVVWDRAGVRGVLWPTQNGFTPRCATEGDLTAVTAWGPDVRLWAGLRSELPPAPVDPEEPEEPEEPVDPETPVKLTSAQLASLKADRDALNKPTLTKEEGGDYINAWCYKHRHDSNQPGMQRDETDPRAFMPDGTPIWAGLRLIEDGKHVGGDCFEGASVGRFTPQDAEFKDADATGPNGRVEAIEPESGEGGGGEEPTDPNLEVRVKALEASDAQLVINDEALARQLGELTAKVHHQGAVINDLIVRLLKVEKTLEEAPGEIELPADVVRVSTHEVKTALTFSSPLTGRIQKKGTSREAARPFKVRFTVDGSDSEFIGTIEPLEP